MKVVQEITPELARSAYRHLSHFVTVNSDQQLAEHLREHIVVQALAHIPASRIGEIVAKIYEVFGMAFEEFEIKAVLSRLVKTRKVRSEIRGRAARYTLTGDLGEQVKDSWRESRNLESQVIDAWGAELAQKYGLTPQAISELQDDLKAFLNAVLRDQGAEFVKLTSSAAPAEVNRLLGNGNGDALARLPHRDDPTAEIRSRELPLFFVNADENRLDYLDQLSQAILVLFAIDIDPNLSALLLNNYTGGVVLLDTNLALRLLAVDGPDLESAAAALVRYSRALGYEPFISLRTVDELGTIVKHILTEFNERSDNPAPAFMETVLLDATYKEDIVKAYYRAYLHEWRRTGQRLTREAFSLELDEPFEMLERKYQLKIFTEHHDWVQAQQEVLIHYTQKIAEASARRPKGQKSRHTAEHDAHNRMLIQRERGVTRPRRFVDAKAWFITDDKTLLVADQWCRKNSELPSIVHSDSWLNMASMCLPRNPDTKAVFARLLAEPYLRTVQMPSQIADRIGGYLALESKYAPEIAARMLQDKMLIEKLERAPLAEAQRELDKVAAEIAAEETKRRAEAEASLQQQTQLASEHATQAAAYATEAVLATTEKLEAVRQKEELEKRLAGLEERERQREQEKAMRARDDEARGLHQLRARRRAGKALLVVTAVGFAMSVPLWQAWTPLHKYFLASGVALVLALGAFMLDGLMGIQKSFRRWTPWAVANLLVIAVAYGVAGVFSDKAWSDLITAVATCASLLANPLSGVYLSSANDPQAKSHVA